MPHTLPERGSRAKTNKATKKKRKPMKKPKKAGY